MCRRMPLSWNQTSTNGRLAILRRWPSHRPLFLAAKHDVDHAAATHVIPSWRADTIARVEAFGGEGTRIAQVLCMEYANGVGIGWHRDKAHFGIVFGLSLGSSCQFRFRRSVGDMWERFVAARMGAQHPAGRGAKHFHHVPHHGRTTRRRVTM